MSMFLPQPQEFRVLPESFTASPRLAGFISAWKGDDATLDCLHAPLETFAGRAVEFQETDLPGAPGCTLVIANDAPSARRLAETAVALMCETVKTLRLCIDGGNMSEPMDGMGKPEAPAEGIQDKPEAYTLCIRPEGIAISGADRAGLFHGVQTLRQALDGHSGSCACLNVRDFPSQRLRGIHFDMKYTFYRIETLLEHLRNMAAMKLNCALFEYEDKFPYQRHPEIVDQAQAFTPEQIDLLRRTAARLHIQIIPLVQTLGHLEFALRHEELADLRETPDGYTMMCPNNPKAVRFVQDLIEEMIEAHPDAKIMHIGGDETSLLGACPTCKKVADEHGPVHIWVEHYRQIVQFTLNKGVRPILWDDIVRRDASKAERLPREAILSYWIYETVRERHGQRAIPKALEQHYSCAGKRPDELPDTLSTYPHYDYYRHLGFDVIAVPCFNVGTLVPCFELTNLNAATWAEKNNLCGGMGMINSAWACYMMHPDAGWYGYAQTADITWWWPSVNRLDLDARFGATFYGIPTPEIAECLAALSVGVGFPSKLKRPLSLLSHAYMENVIHFEGNMEMRQKLGQAVTFRSKPGRPIGQAGVLDPHNHLLRKLELIEEDGLRNEVRRQLDYAEPLMSSVLRRLEAVAPLARRHGEVIDLLIMQAAMKGMRCRHWRFFLDAYVARADEVSPDTRKRAAALLEQENALRERFDRTFRAKLCDDDTDIIVDRMFSGERQFLSDLAAGKPIPVSRRTRFADMADKAEDIRDI